MTRTRTIAGVIIISLLLLMGTIAIGDPSQTILDNLVLYVPFDEGTGAITYDYSGNGYHGQLFSNTINQVDKWTQPTANDNHWTTGKWGNALRGYNGTFYNNQNGDILTKEIVDTHILGEGTYVENSVGGQYSSRDWSYSVWVRRPTDKRVDLTSSWVNLWSLDAAEATSTQDESSIDWWEAAGGLEYDHLHTRYDGQYQVYTNRFIKTFFNAGTTQEIYAIGNPLGTTNGNGAWQNIIVTIHGDPDGADRFIVKIYVNGVLATQIVQNSSGGWGYMPAEAITIGSTDLKGIGLNDDVDDVGVWNRLLTSAEIAWLQTNPVKPTPPLSPVVTWPDNNGITNPSGTLQWQPGPSAPYASYDVYWGTSLQDVLNADRNPTLTCTNPPAGDIDGDCEVDIYDLEAIADCWLNASSCDPAADLLADGTIDLGDFNILSQYWASSTPLTPSYNPTYKGNQTGTEYSFSGLTVDQMYYWRVDGVKSGGEIGRGNLRSFTVKPVWKQDRFVNLMGWAELFQMAEANKAAYAQSLKNLGIRHVFDNSSTIPYHYGLQGIEVFLYHNPTGAEYAVQYRHTPGNAGYFQFDEPSNGVPEKTMAMVANYHQQCHDADPSRPSYTNLYSSDGTGISGYQAYVNTFFDAFTGTAKPEILSFDCYPYRYGFNDHYWSLHIARQKALTAGIPLWNWQQTQQRGSFGAPSSSTVNRNRLRNVCYSSLAYGVKGISWFDINRVYTFSGADFSRNFTQVATWWADLAAINAEINRVGDAMLNLTSQDVYHTNAVSGITLPLLTGNFWVQVSQSNSGFVIGTFKDAQNNDYVMIHNKDDATTVSNKQITFQNTVVNAVSVFNEQNGNWDSLSVQGTYPNRYVQITMGPGYGKLLKIN